MYNNSYGPTFSNNPFVNDPSNPQTRFPDISAVSSHNPWLQASSDLDSLGYQSQSSHKPSQTSATFGNQSNYFSQAISQQPTGAPFQPTSAFGQHLAGTLNGSSYGYLTGQSPGQNGYHPAQQQLQSIPSYVAQFDPYAPTGQGWNGSPHPPAQIMNSHNVPSSTSGTFSTPASPTGNPHPREYLRSHKAEIEAWDGYAWNQLFNVFDTLKEAWEGRAKELEGGIGQLQMPQYGGTYHPAQIQQEQARLQALLKEARSHFDSIAASSFQMREVFQGYRQSGDLASKRRVREACNAAVNGLPYWPPQI